MLPGVAARRLSSIYLSSLLLCLGLGLGLGILLGSPNTIVSMHLGPHRTWHLYQMNTPPTTSMPLALHQCPWHCINAPRYPPCIHVSYTYYTYLRKIFCFCAQGTKRILENFIHKKSTKNKVTPPPAFPVDGGFAPALCEKLDQAFVQEM